MQTKSLRTILAICITIPIAACGSGTNTTATPADDGTAVSSSTAAAVAPTVVDADTTQPASEMDMYVSQFVQSGVPAGLTFEESCVSGVVSRIPTPEDAERSLRNLTGNIESDADNELVLSWIEDELLQCAPVDQIVALLTQYADGQGVSLDAGCASDFVSSAADFADLESKVVEACGS